MSLDNLDGAALMRKAAEEERQGNTERARTLRMAAANRPYRQTNEAQEGS